MHTEQLKAIRRNEKRLFLKRWLKHPFRLGTITPSSQALSDMVLQKIDYQPGQYVVELGAGTGTLTRGLIQDVGIPADKIYPLELDPEFFDFLQKSLPKVNAICANATDLLSVLPKEVIGNVSTVLSNLPFTYIPLKIQQQIMDASFAVLSPEGQVIQFGFNPASPVRVEKLGLNKRRLGMTFKSFPPAYIWQYEQKGQAELNATMAA